MKNKKLKLNVLRAKSFIVDVSLCKGGRGTPVDPNYQVDLYRHGKVDPYRTSPVDPDRVVGVDPVITGD